MTIDVGNRVSWIWGNGSKSGVTVKRFAEDVKLTLDGTTEIRKAGYATPAILIEQDGGVCVLQSLNELKKE